MAEFAGCRIQHPILNKHPLSQASYPLRLAVRIRQSAWGCSPSAFNASAGLLDDPSRHQADAIPGAVAVGALPPMSKSWAGQRAAIVRVAVSSRTKHSKSVE